MWLPVLGIKAQNVYARTVFRLIAGNIVFKALVFALLFLLQLGIIILDFQVPLCSIVVQLLKKSEIESR